jgi:DNA invertase Pin-like site-specific DNA recombinase
MPTALKVLEMRKPPRAYHGWQDAIHRTLTNQERTKARLAAARARVRLGGQPKVAAVEAKVALARKLHADKGLEIDNICQTLRISRSTLYRYARL